MEGGEIIAQYLCQLPDEFKSLLKRKEAGEITQKQLEDQCDIFILTKLHLLDPKPFPTKPQRLIEFNGLTRKEKKESREEIRPIKSQWEFERFEISQVNEINLRELRRLLRKYKTTNEAEKILKIIDKHQEYYPPFKGSV